MVGGGQEGQLGGARETDGIAIQQPAPGRRAQGGCRCRGGLTCELLLRNVIMPISLRPTILGSPVKS